MQQIADAGFDGMYSYFATDGFTYGSTRRNWPAIESWCRARSPPLLWVPSIGPGYEDTEVRPWNGANSRDRRGGGYYRDAMR